MKLFHVSLTSSPTVHNLRPYGRMRPSIMKFAAVHMYFQI